MAREAPALAGIERWMQALVTHPDGVQRGLEAQRQPVENLERIVLPSRQLNARDRLSVYANMYFLRLQEIMQGEYPTVRYLLGDELFNKVVKYYVTLHPSTYYNLNRLSHCFPRFLLQEAGDIPHRRFAASVASVERAMEEVFDERLVERVAIEAIFAFPEEQRGDLRLELTPALRLLTLDYPVNDYMTAVKEDRQPIIPPAGKTHVLIYRCNYTVWRLDLDPLRYVLLSRLQAGDCLQAALEACDSEQDADVDQLVSALGDWFREWASQGLFCGVKLRNQERG